MRNKWEVGNKRERQSSGGGGRGGKKPLPKQLLCTYKSLDSAHPQPKSSGIISRLASVIAFFRFTPPSTLFTLSQSEIVATIPPGSRIRLSAVDVLNRLPGAGPSIGYAAYPFSLRLSEVSMGPFCLPPTPVSAWFVRAVLTLFPVVAGVTIHVWCGVGGSAG